MIRTLAVSLLAISSLAPVDVFAATTTTHSTTVHRHKTRKTVKRVGIGAGAGAAVGALAGGGKGAAIGALVGGGGGAVYDHQKRKSDR